MLDTLLIIFMLTPYHLIKQLVTSKSIFVNTNCLNIVGRVSLIRMGRGDVLTHLQLLIWCLMSAVW